MLKKLSLLSLIFLVCSSVYSNEVVPVSSPDNNLDIDKKLDDNIIKYAYSLREGNTISIHWQTGDHYKNDLPMIIRYTNVVPDNGSPQQLIWKYSAPFLSREKSYSLDGLVDSLDYTLEIGYSVNQISTSDVSANKNVLWNKVNKKNSSLFRNIFAQKKIEGACIKWGIDYNYTRIVDSIIIKYADKIEAKSLNPDWKYLGPYPASDYEKNIDNLVGNEEYVIQIGTAKQGTITAALSNKNGMIWSEKISLKTERPWGLLKFLVLIGSLGLFIYGMKIMSEGLQQASGSRLRSMLGSITSNRFKGVLTGFSITGLVQSSSVTTIMTVSFVNAGLMTLVQSAGVMMGANVGTTITGWLVQYFGFKINIASYALVFIAIAAPLLFISRGKAKSWASTIIGFSLLFMGLGFLKDAVPDLDQNSPLVQFFIRFKDMPFIGNVMFVLLGTFVTIVIQSSSAAMALTMAMVSKGIIPFEVACAMILGENIGTTITAEIASLIGNVHAKRSARIHSLFNVFGVVWMLILIPFVLQIVAMMIPGDPFANDQDGWNSALTGVALFHTVFNAANVLLLIWFIPQLVKIAIKTVKSKGDADEEFHLDYIGAGMMGTPELSILEAKKEVAKFGIITGKMSVFMQHLLTEQDRKKKVKIYKKIRKYEEITDRVEEEISSYLGKVSEHEMSKEVSKRVTNMLSVINDLERIGDIFYQMSMIVKRKEEDKIWFTQEQRDNLSNMFKVLDKAFDVMTSNLDANYDKVSLQKALSLEKEINSLRDKLRHQHLDKIGKREYNVKSGMAYNDLFAACEKVGDHVFNVSEVISGENIF